MADEGRIVYGLVDAARVVDDQPAEGVEPRLLRVPHPAADVDLARRKVEVAADAMRSPFGDLRAVRIRARPREARRDVGLVRRLVLREPDVAVDAERGPAGIRGERDTARVEPLPERGDERLERLLEQPLV